jgi:hypothetical protein
VLALKGVRYVKKSSTLENGADGYTGFIRRITHCSSGSGSTETGAAGAGAATGLSGNAP